MKHAVIIHGWKSNPESNWKPWLATELKAAGFRVDIPVMPDPQHPNADDWVATLAETVGRSTDDTYLIGHSLGCMTILRYLEGLNANEKIRAALFVAGFGMKFQTYHDQHDSFFDHELDWAAIRSHCDAFVAIHSDNDPSIKLDQMALFKRELGAKAIVVPGMGHFGSADKTYELPIVRDELFLLS